MEQFNWAALVPLVILLTAAVKDAGIFKNLDNRIVNLLVGAVVVGVAYLLPLIGINALNIGVIESIVIILVNPVVYDKWIAPFLDYFSGNANPESQRRKVDPPTGGGGVPPKRRP